MTWLNRKQGHCAVKRHTFGVSKHESRRPTGFKRPVKNVSGDYFYLLYRICKARHSSAVIIQRYGVDKAVSAQPLRVPTTRENVQNKMITYPIGVLTLPPSQLLA